jgi:hypothetical protein
LKQNFPLRAGQPRAKAISKPGWVFVFVIARIENDRRAIDYEMRKEGVRSEKDNRKNLYISG